MKKFISLLLLFLSMILACDRFNAIYNERWTDNKVPVFKTGSTGGTDSGEDGHADMQWGATWTSSRFTDNGDGTITDNNTGLMWMKNADLGGWKQWRIGSTTSYPALERVAAINANGAENCGYNDWRLPNVHELTSLVNYGESDLKAWLGAQGFSITSERFWTSTTVINNNTYAYNLNVQPANYFLIGSDKDTSNVVFVWPVRGHSSRLLVTGQTTSYAAGDDRALQKGVSIPTQRFYDNGDGTMTDRKTNLMWSKHASPLGQQTWSNALTSVSGLNTGGYTDWRLPNVEELKTLIYYGNQNWHSTQGFTNVQLAAYWTSTAYKPAGGNAWFASFIDGAFSMAGTGSSYYVWPVRGGEK